MAATLMSVILTLLNQDIDDSWSSAATADGDAGMSYLVDNLLYEKVADWVDDGMILYLPLGPGGSGTAETRVVDRLEGNKLYPKTAFSAQVVDTAVYEVHKLFTRSQKLTALRNAATLICPGIHAVVRDRSKEIVDNQFEYDISSLLIYQNRPHQILIAQEAIEDIWINWTFYKKDDVVRPASLSTFSGYTYICTSAGISGGTEPIWPTTKDGTIVDSGTTWTRRDELDYSNYPMLPLHDWDITPDGKLFLNASYTTGRKLMIVGIKPLAFTGTAESATETIALDSPFTLVLSAQAAMYLWKQRAGSAGSQNIERATQQVQNWYKELMTRKAQYWMKPPEGTIITGPGLTV